MLRKVRDPIERRLTMSIIKSAIVAAALVAVAATANAQSREDLNSGYHGNTPVYSSPYGPSDAIEQSARNAYGQAGARTPRAGAAPRYQPRVRYYNNGR
jgi:hypothetical protein